MSNPNQNIDLKIDELVYSHADDLYNWAFYKTKNKETAQDLVQDTFVAAFENMNTFKNKSTPKTWLFGILKNKVAEHFRSLAKQKLSSVNEDNFSFFFENNGKWKPNQIPQSWEEDQHLLDNEDFIKILEFCKDKLPSLLMSILELKYITQKKGKEICQDLSISETNYWQVMHRAKLSLRSCINDNWFNSING